MCTLRKMYILLLLHGVFCIRHMSVRFNSSIVLFKSPFFLKFILCPIVVSIFENVVLNYPAIIVLLSISPFNFVKCLLHILGSANVVKCVCL